MKISNNKKLTDTQSSEKILKLQKRSMGEEEENVDKEVEKQVQIFQLRNPILYKIKSLKKQLEYVEVKYKVRQQIPQINQTIQSQSGSGERSDLQKLIEIQKFNLQRVKDMRLNKELKSNQAENKMFIASNKQKSDQNDENPDQNDQNDDHNDHNDIKQQQMKANHKSVVVEDLVNTPKKQQIDNKDGGTHDNEENQLKQQFEQLCTQFMKTISKPSPKKIAVEEQDPNQVSQNLVKVSNQIPTNLHLPTNSQLPIIASHSDSKQKSLRRSKGIVISVRNSSDSKEKKDDKVCKQNRMIDEQQQGNFNWDAESLSLLADILMKLNRSSIKNKQQTLELVASQYNQLTKNQLIDAKILEDKLKQDYQIFFQKEIQKNEKYSHLLLLDVSSAKKNA